MKTAKKRNQTGRIGLRWFWILLLQLAAMLLLGVGAALSLWLGGVVHGICMWGLTPVLGAVSAYFATKHGLLNYAAWIAPPLMQGVAYALLWGYSPDPGPLLVCAFVSLVGAATGEVVRRQNKKG